MTQEAQSKEPVIAIWNPTLTLKICLGAMITQEPGTCEYLAPEDDADECRDEGCDAEACGDEPIGCDELAWPRYPGPIVVSGTGSRTSARRASGRSTMTSWPAMTRPFPSVAPSCPADARICVKTL